MKRITTIRRNALARFVVVARLRRLVLEGLAAFAVVLLGSTAPVLAQSSNGLIVADFNHDGIPDVLAPSGAAAFTLSFGSVPYGTFSTVAKIVSAPSGCSAVVPNTIVTGDFNGDGFADLAMVCTGSPTAGSIYTVYVMLGAGDGNFLTSASFPGLSGLVDGDFNHDGLTDLVTVGSNGLNGAQSVTMLTGKGDGTFQTPKTATISSNTYSSVVAVLIDQDGYPDLALGNFASPNGNTVDIYGNNKDGTFGIAGSGVYGPSVSIPVGGNPSSIDTTILAGTYSGSGLMDIAVVDTGTNPGIFIARNTSKTGTFTFAAPTKIAIAGLQSAVTASFTSVLPEFLVSTGATLSVLANDGSGNFSATPYSGLTLANTTSLYAGVDANGDGHADVYAATVAGPAATITVSLVSGTATAVSQPFSLPAGSTPVTAMWAGNINYTGATANGSQTVNAIASSVGLTSSKNPSLVGDNVTFTASVLPASSGVNVPSGTLTFMDGATPLGTVTLSGLSGSVSVSTLAAGSHNISVVYSGDAIFAGSTLSLTEQVNKTVPAITWPTPAHQPYGTLLSNAQLNAVATNPVGGGVIPGTFTYMPAAGTLLNAGTQTLSVLFTPTDLATFATATGSTTILIDKVAANVAWTPAVGTIAYGTPLGPQQLNATATDISNAPLAGIFVYQPAAGTVLGVGSQRVTVQFTPNSANYLATGQAATINVTQAAPVISWTTPASIAYGVPLSATQLDATITGAGGATLAGTLAYTPAAGTILTPGTHTLSVLFTPTDTTDYTSLTTTVNLVVSDLALAAFTPSNAPIGASATTITITGSGFVATTMAQVNGTNIATTLVNSTTLTAVIPASYLTASATLQVTLTNPSTGAVSAAQAFTVSTPTAAPTLNAPSTTPPGSQPAINFGLTTPYPAPLVAIFTINDKSNVATGVVDPSVQFATGGNSYTVTLPVNSLTLPPIQVQAGTLAATITVPVTLTANGVNVLPGTLAATIVVPPAVPLISTTKLDRNGTQLTVTVTGFSNTLDIVKADFHFTPISGASLATSDFTAQVGRVFATYFAQPTTLTFGSTFVYTQVFNVSDAASNIGSVQVTLTNSVGASTSQTAQ